MFTVSKYRELDELVDFLLDDRLPDDEYGLHNGTKSPFLCDRSKQHKGKDSEFLIQNWLLESGGDTGFMVFSDGISYDDHSENAQLARSMFLLFTKEFLKDCIV